MYYRGVRWGFSFWRYDVSMDENTWTFTVGWGGLQPPGPPGEHRNPYSLAVMVQWRPLATCFEWWSEYLGVETQWHHRGYEHTRIRCGLVRQYRIYSFRRWPVAVRFFMAPRVKFLPPDHVHNSEATFKGFRADCFLCRSDREKGIERVVDGHSPYRKSAGG